MEKGTHHTEASKLKNSLACKQSYLKGRKHCGGKKERLGPDAFCVNGHPRIPENLRSQLCSDGRRNWRCRICHRQQQLARYYEDRETHLAKAAVYQAKNRARHNEICRKWNHTLKGKQSKRLLGHRRGGLRRDREAITYTTILLNDPCSYCGGLTEAIDHIVPVADKGTSDWFNLTAACKSCNQRKNDRSLLIYLAISTGLVRSFKAHGLRLRRRIQ